METQGKPSPLRNCVIIRHARESGHPGILNYSIKQQLDSGACPVLDTGFAGMTPLFPNYDTVTEGGGKRVGVIYEIIPQLQGERGEDF